MLSWTWTVIRCCTRQGYLVVSVHVVYNCTLNGDRASDGKTSSALFWLPKQTQVFEQLIQHKFSWACQERASRIAATELTRSRELSVLPWLKLGRAQWWSWWPSSQWPKTMREGRWLLSCRLPTSTRNCPLSFSLVFSSSFPMTTSRMHCSSAGGF